MRTVANGTSSVSTPYRVLPATEVAGKRALNRLIANFAIGLGVFLLGFVMSEPAPYELYMVALIAIAMLFGMRLTRTSLVLLALLTVFNFGGMISVMQMADTKDAPLYIAVSLFLAFTAVFYAAIIEADYRRLKTIFNAYLLVGILSSLLGIAGYLNLFPGADAFTRYGRAMGGFKDPNVYGPFLVLPFTWSLYRIMKGNGRDLLVYMPLCSVLTLGILVSFSRAAWAMAPLSFLCLFAVLLLQSQSNRFRLRLITIGLLAVLVIALAILLLLQIPDVRALFLERARLEQSYDSARLGRFARHWLGMVLATEHPLGIGPLEFGPMFGEDTHNIWLKAVLDYGWIGFIAFMTLTFLTLAIGFKLMFRNRPWQPFLLCAYATYLGHVLIGNVIDTDHWRHFYLLFGLVWGCAGLEYKHYRKAASHNQFQGNLLCNS
ncbi:O-antigen ligase like membrane family protein [Ochrobactrum quorumnocens]|uniref:O-antigen ligase like membrane family protein n=1 Tax=Ochrobactrum quorumnocens TaxID=271865 RepID=A0A248UKP6_9HYPH|nr:O-antigen ligase family protein [[Ochrobactrum] quorumnocens]ASV87120.1 O-antigen ligase like membrane family protein [[Ochrobactrum] quorumnocens]